MKVFGKGFNFEQDGPGNRLVYHLSGCNMRCIWCSNPQGFESDAGTDYTADQIVAEAESCVPLFFSGGGVTFTGGEATLWAEELLDLLKKLKDKGIHTCIETNGTSVLLPKISEYTDYLIMDYKHYDGEKLKEYTGCGINQINENFFKLIGRQLHIRIPLINGINTDHPEMFAKFFRRYNCENIVFEFLSYHEYGREKWQTEYKVKNGFVSADTLNKFKECFKEYNLKIIET